MKIGTTKKFDKQFLKLRPAVQLRFRVAINTFRSNPFDEALRNHPVQGKKYKGYRSIDVTGDVRALYAEKSEDLIVFGFIGTHSQLYG